MDISIVIPAFNEGRKIDKDIRLAQQFFRDTKMTGEIIISNDGSTDDTLKIPEKIVSSASGSLRIIDNKKHYGKGKAVQSGILEATGEIILFIDSGACIPYEDILPGVLLIKKNISDIAHASRFLPGSHITKKKQWHRRILSILFRKFILSWMKVSYYLTDTQCGLKIYKKAVAHVLYKQCITKGFMFDIEVILRAEKVGYTIREFPVSWTSDPDSRLLVSNVFFSMMPELWRIKRNL